MFPISVCCGNVGLPPMASSMTGYIQICSESSFGLDTFNDKFIFHNYDLKYGNY